MKNLLHLGLLILFAIILVGCEKNEEEHRNNFVLAGQKDNTMLVKDYEPDLHITLTNNVVNGIPSTGYSGTLLIDTDFDGSNDLEFYSFYGMGHPIGYVTPTEGCKIECISTDKKIEIFMSPKHQNDTIDNKHIWTTTSLQTYLSSYDPDNIGINSNFWDAEDLYMGFRMIQLKDTTYGWISLQIAENYKLVIKEIGIQK